MRTQPAAAALLLLIASPLFADVKLPAIFGDHMVLQRDAKVPIWGTAAAGESVTITASDAKASATADADGKWTATLEGLKASDKPIDVTVAGKNSITLHDVLIGDVWVCSGQSNMEFGLGGANGAADVIAKSANPTMRLFLLKKNVAIDPQTDCEGTWEVSSPISARRFSAVGYFFAQDIMADQHVPVGMIGTYWGGTPAQAWTSLEALKAAPALASYVQTYDDHKANLPALKKKYDEETFPKWKAAMDAARKQMTEDNAKAKATGQSAPPPPKVDRQPTDPTQDPHKPTVLSNAMIAPIVHYAIKGAIWYQGEANVGGARQYQTLFPTMITDWRTRWGEGDFPFIWVQLANYLARTPDPTQKPDGWPALREAQSMTLKLPNTGQAVIIDIGEESTIHPKDKIDVGHRLALAARHVAYGEDLVYSGPTYDALKIDGDKARVSFKNIGSGLAISAAPATQPSVPAPTPLSELKGFSIAGADHNFVWATAMIEPSTGSGQAADSVVVSSPQVHDPQAVRYGWANNPEVNLYNKEGLPASPFRTDDWAAGPTTTPTTAAAK